MWSSAIITSEWCWNVILVKVEDLKQKHDIQWISFFIKRGKNMKNANKLAVSIWYNLMVQKTR